MVKKMYESSKLMSKDKNPIYYGAEAYTRFGLLKLLFSTFMHKYKNILEDVPKSRLELLKEHLHYLEENYFVEKSHDDIVNKVEEEKEELCTTVENFKIRLYNKTGDTANGYESYLRTRVLSELVDVILSTNAMMYSNGCNIPRVLNAAILIEEVLDMFSYNNCKEYNRILKEQNTRGIVDSITPIELADAILVKLEELTVATMVYNGIVERIITMPVPFDETTGCKGMEVPFIQKRIVELDGSLKRSKLTQIALSIFDAQDFADTSKKYEIIKILRRIWIGLNF